MKKTISVEREALICDRCDKEIVDKDSPCAICGKDLCRSCRVVVDAEGPQLIVRASFCVCYIPNLSPSIQPHGDADMGATILIAHLETEFLARLRAWKDS